MSYTEESVWDTVLLNTFVVCKKKCKVYFHHGTLIWETEAPPHYAFRGAVSSASVLRLTLFVRLMVFNFSRNTDEEETAPKNASVQKTRATLPVEDIINVDYVHSSDLSCCLDTGRYIHDLAGSSQDLDYVDNSLQHLAFKIHYVNHEKQNKWRYRVVVLKSNDPRQVSTWVKTFRTLLKGFTHRPKRLLVFVNPFGGKKKGLKIYENAVKPLFDVAGIEVDLTITQRQNHARDTLLNEPLSDFDGIICVGGDGTFSEIMNGLITRTARDQGVDPNNPNNELPKPSLRVGVIPGGSTDTVAYCIHGTTDIETAVIHIIIGESSGLDVSSVHNDSRLLCYYASVISYGYLGDIIRDSDKFRWMGPKRYDFSGFKKFLANQGYEGEITLAINSSNAHEDSKCFKDCRRCLSQKDVRFDDSSQEWKLIRGKFLMVNGANLSCACPRSPNGISPHCHMGDGCLDLVLVKHTSLINNLRLLLTLSNRMKSIYDLPFVEVHRTTQFTFQALPSPARNSSDVSVWNCDGEVLVETTLHIRAHCQLLQVFFRGVEACLEDDQHCKCF